MEPFRFLHAADLHLDSRFSGLAHIPSAVRSLLRESTFAALGRLVGVAIQEKVDFVVLSGDIYDVSDSSLQGQLRFQEALQELGREGIGVFMIHGNHDPLDGPRLVSNPPDHVTIFGSEKPDHITATRRSDGCEVAVISGLSYPTMRVTENTAQRFERKQGCGLYHIALHHCNLDGDLQHETYAPCSRKDLIEKGYDYWALGHIHTRNIVHERPYIVYPGNIQGRSIKEIGTKGCYVVDVNEEGTTTLKFHELDVVRWQVREISIQGLKDETQWIAAVEQEIEDLRIEHSHLMSVVRFRLTGRGVVHRLLTEKGAVADLLSELQRREGIRAEQKAYQGIVWTEGFSLETGVEMDKERLLQEDSFLGDLLRYSNLGKESPEELESLTRTALAPMMENRELRRLLSETPQNEKRIWLERAAELAATLLSGAEEPGRDEEMAAHPQGRT